MQDETTGRLVKDRKTILHTQRTCQTKGDLVLAVIPNGETHACFHFSVFIVTFYIN